MPTLSSKPIAFEILEPQLPPSTLVAIQSMQIITERFNEIYMESFRKMLEDIHALIELQNKAMIQALAVEFSFNKLFPKGIFNFTPPTPFKAVSLGIFGTATDGEIVEPRKVETVLLQATIPVPTSRSKMGLRHISGGNFSHKRKTLVGLSLRNREGQLMELMLENPDLFVSDATINEKFYTQDTFGRSDLIKLLKNKFKLNKLEAIIKRQGEGYILINIRPHYIN